MIDTKSPLVSSTVDSPTFAVPLYGAPLYSSCVSEFTNGQRERMYAMFEYFRMDETTIILPPEKETGAPTASSTKPDVDMATDPPTAPPRNGICTDSCSATSRGKPRYNVSLQRRLRLFRGSSGCRTLCATESQAKFLLMLRWNCGKCG
jgi:hypothetical protein